MSQVTLPEELEIGEEDILFVEDACDGDVIIVDVESGDVELCAPENVSRPVLPEVTPPPKPSQRPLTSRQARIDRFEDDVADECLASIAAVASQTRLADPPDVIVPPAPRLPAFDGFPVEDDVDDAAQTIRLPALSAAEAQEILPESVPGVALASGPPPAFVRTWSSSVPAGLSASSVAPVAISAGYEPTVRLVRPPTRTGWIVAAAIVGAACAAGAMQLMAAAPEPGPSTPSAAAAPEAEPVPAAVAAPAPAAPAAPAAPEPAVVRFGDDQAVAIKVDAARTAPAASVTPAPPVPAAAPVNPPAKRAAPAAKSSASLGPRLPDGSVALGARVEPPATAAPSRSNPSTPTSTPSAPRKKKTPEQELAEAQLKASMK